jgi:AcrR family transcriptional regulator
MPRHAQLSKNELAQRLVPIFQQYGYDGATLKKLSEATNLSKASLYHHYPNGKEDMAKHALAYTGNRLQKYVLTPLSGSAPKAAIIESLNGTLEFYNDDTPICLMNSLMLGEGNNLFGKDIKQAVNVWAAALAQNLSKLKMSDKTSQTLARETIEAIQGSLILCRLERNTEPLHACIDKLKRNLTE